MRMRMLTALAMAALMAGPVTADERREKQIAAEAGDGLGGLMRRELALDLPSLNEAFVTPAYAEGPDLCRIDRLLIDYDDGDRDKPRGFVAENWFHPLAPGESCNGRSRPGGGFFTAATGDDALTAMRLWRRFLDDDAGRYPVDCIQAETSASLPCTAEDLAGLRTAGFTGVVNCDARPPFLYADRCYRFTNERLVQITWSLKGETILRVDVGPPPTCIFLGL